MIAASRTSSFPFPFNSLSRTLQSSFPLSILSRQRSPRYLLAHATMESVPDYHTSLRDLVTALDKMLTQHRSFILSTDLLAQHASELIEAYQQATTPLAPSTATSSGAACFDKLSTTESGPATPVPEKEDLLPDSEAAGESKTLLVIESPRHTSLRRTLVPCYGTCPQDVPLELGTTYTTIDRRMLTP